MNELLTRGRNFHRRMRLSVVWISRGLENEEALSVPEEATLGDVRTVVAQIIRASNNFTLWIGNPPKHDLSAFDPTTKAASVLTNLCCLYVTIGDPKSNSSKDSKEAEKNYVSHNYKSSTNLASLLDKRQVGTQPEPKPEPKRRLSRETPVGTQVGTQVKISEAKGVDSKGEGGKLSRRPLRDDGKDESAIFVVDNLLSKKECKRLIKATETADPSLGLKDTYSDLGWNKRYRSNDRLVVFDEKLADMLGERLRPAMPSYIMVKGKKWEYIGLNECFRFCRYRKGQHFSKHCDSNFKRNSKETSFYTVNIYLNGSDEFNGGGTRFYLENSNHSLVTDVLNPKAGQACLFDHENRDFLHDGEKLYKGTKYLLRSDAMYRQISTPEEYAQK
uniref:Fe2OG dioxygenase domain-containing protein n=1 Tax=Amorphochlora amoebiformis TaxID=1561963 RepID=A0A7S0D245_9EUKA|mmetsp:Transcript_16714/g.26537  ORF Transcript_16714/g.26537 Transcript_16714/m.26537 type:complete len:389 (+) Transcript_16714:1-1167(+)